MAILIAYDNPIDQYIVRNPGYFFSSLHERAIIDSQNPYILADHLLCAAHEIPIENTEVEALFGERAWEVLGVLADNGTLSYRRRWYWTGTGHPAADVNIRSSSNETFNIVNIERGGTLLGTVDGVNIYLTVYPGAIYLHGGESYIVTRFSLEEHAAFVERTEVDYYTTPGELHTITVDQEIESRPFGAAKLSFGDVEVSTKITHFWRKQLFTERIIDKTPLDLPEVTLNTEAVWITLPIEMTSKMLGRGLDLVGSIHAIEHAAIGIMPLFALCDRNDIGGVSNPEHPDTDNHAAIFIYDGHRGGVGLSRTAYETYQDLLTATLKTIEDCECEDGCPSCIQSPKCGNNNEPLDKAGAVYLLREVLKGPL